MRLSYFAAVLALAACSQPAPAPPPAEPAAQNVTVYERYAALERDPAFRAKLALPAERIQDMAWMIGTWRTTVQIGDAPPDPAEDTTFRMQGDSLIVSSDLSTVLGYDSFAGRWFSAGFEPPAAAMTQAFSTQDWDGHAIVFDADVRLFGERFVLRQTMTKLSDNEFELVNEQLVAPGQYRRVDAYHYVRVTD